MWQRTAPALDPGSGATLRPLGSGWSCPPGQLPGRSTDVTLLGPEMLGPGLFSGRGLKGHPGRSDPNPKEQVTDRTSHWAGKPSSTVHLGKGSMFAMLTLLSPCVLFLFCFPPAMSEVL